MNVYMSHIESKYPRRDKYIDTNNLLTHEGNNQLGQAGTEPLQVTTRVTGMAVFSFFALLLLT